MVCIVFDTSFLVNCAKAKVDWYEETRRLAGNFAALVPSPVIRELEALSEENRWARIALEVLKTKEHEVVDIKGGADDAVVALARERSCWVASTDKEVRRRSGAPLLTLRRGKYIELPEM